ncbi:GntR family transcriptional regulator [Asanoa iriomotensis]|uniref:Transcriptional regulator n=1 Tax=Asanoa iriomotensis TaxID=234613 RepID=A0ABQ4C0E0_9ACTN|nr:GntR family transcriptional regulator [Asanoa iriomotensis]GIF55765.1 transcriptional regulator [Asanoa iriomotensis]
MTTSSSGRLTTRVRQVLADRISRGDLRPGDQLPTERELSGEFGVSRVTVRRALASLSRDGLVYSVQGRGTFVAADRLAEPPNTLLSFHDLVANTYVSVAAQPLRVHTRPATLDEAETFGIAPGASLFELDRLRTLDDLPVAIDSTLLPLAIDPELPDLDWSHESLYARLTAAGHTPVAADYSVEARAADIRVARLLGTVPGSPVLVAESEVSDQSGRLIVAGLITYRGDRYRFRSRLTAGSAVPMVQPSSGRAFRSG